MPKLNTLILRHHLFMLLFLAVLVRVVALVVLAPTLDFGREGNAIHGSEGYDEYALNLLESGVYGRALGTPDALLPPMYSIVLAGVYAVFGRGFVTIGVFHIVLDVLAFWLLYDIAHRLMRSRLVAALALAFGAFYPYLIFQNLTLIDTPFWMFLLHAFVWAMLRLRDAESPARAWLGWAIGAGVVLGVATLTRPITPPLAVLASVWFLFRLPFWQSVLRIAPVALITLGFLGVWIGRNWAVYDAFVPMTLTSGANFWQGNSKWTIPVFRAGYDVQWTAPEGITAPLNSREADAQRFALGAQFLEQNPDKLAELLWVKFLVHWSIELAPRYNPMPNERWELDSAGALRVVRAEASITGVTAANTSYNSGLLDTLGRPLHALYFGVLLLLAIVGTLVTARQWRDVSILWMVQICMTLVYVFFHPATRYRAPSDPLLFVLSAVALAWLYSIWQAQRQILEG